MCHACMHFLSLDACSCCLARGLDVPVLHVFLQSSAYDVPAFSACLQESRLTDGAGQRPAYSLRSLCRALDYARRAAPAYGLQRALWDGFSMSFLTQLSPEAGARLAGIMAQHLLPGGAKNLKVCAGRVGVWGIG